ncbi:MAG TPA: DUF4832 domain-containing protein [Hanamia sp.]
MKKLILLVIAFVLISCQKNGKNNNSSPTDSNTQKVSYQESTEDFVNPGRGFYRYAATNTSSFQPLDKNTLLSYRSGAIVPGTQNKFFSSLVFRNYILDNFKSGPLSQDFLNKMNQDFDIARQAGIKFILRFSYTNDSHVGCSTGSICPPYGDAPLSVVLGQIAQLKPFLQQNADVIACVQEGFIGIWGEGYYTDYFGDASSNAGQNKLLDSNWNARNALLKALLDAVPKDRMIQVRYPQIKQRYVYGISSPISSAALMDDEAFTADDKARIGFHNDCFLADVSDEGTFQDYGNSNSPASLDQATINTLRSYVAADSKFVPVGGESCTNSAKSQCDPTGTAQTEMATFHYSFLNGEYSPDVIGNWANGGCLNTIKNNLGYRFVLENATFPLTVKAGGTLSFNLGLKNVGYASPYNERPAQLILRNSTTSQVVVLTLNTDVRKWYSGEIAINDSVTLPASLPAGTYDLLLNMPDKYSSIAQRPEYSIRCANSNVWEVSTGYNKLNCSIVVK